MDADQEGPSKRQGSLEGRAANHFEVAFTQFDFLIDFGQEYENSGPPILHTRIILTPHAAETLTSMLTELIAEYHRTIGTIAERKP